MGSATEDRAKAAELPEGDVIRILLEQHARIRTLFAEVTAQDSDHRQHVFDELRALLAVHETAEQMVLRPVTTDLAGAEIADERNEEEAEATEVLAELEKLDVESAEFAERIAGFQSSVVRHADAEEAQEFPHILERCDAEKRQRLGKQIKAAESIAPTHPHPSAAGHPTAHYAIGPVLSVIDRARDALGKAMPGD